MNDKEKLESHKRMCLSIQEQAKKDKYFDEEDKISDYENLENMYPELLDLVEDLISDLEKVVNKNEKDKGMKFNEEKNNKFYGDKIAQLKKEREEEFEGVFSGIAESVVSYTELVNKIDLVLKNQEVIIKLLAEHTIPELPKESNKTTRKVYKELIINKGRKIQVGCVLPFSQILEFNKPNDIANHSSFIKNLNVYYPEFYVEDISDNGYVYNLFKPSNNIIEIVDKSKDTRCVTGFLLDNGKVIYYDQYL